MIEDAKASWLECSSEHDVSAASCAPYIGLASGIYHLGLGKSLPLSREELT
jgi:hypothetical protein